MRSGRGHLAFFAQPPHEPNPERGYVEDQPQQQAYTASD